MSQLLSGKQKGRFGAPPEASVQRSPWAYVPIIFLLPLTIIIGVITLVSWVTYYNCGDVWYQPQFVGEDVTYVVVGPPGGI